MIMAALDVDSAEALIRLRAHAFAQQPDGARGRLGDRGTPVAAGFAGLARSQRFRGPSQ
jgi:hypothetical protein